MLQIKEFVDEVGKNAITHGWWEEERSFGELIALCHSELSEALEEYREGILVTEAYYSCNGCSQKCKYTGKNFHCIHRPDELLIGKPEGIPSELADVIIRIFDMCHHYGIDIEEAIREKHDFNISRPYKHGGKVI